MFSIPTKSQSSQVGPTDVPFQLAHSFLPEAALAQLKFYAFLSAWRQFYCGVSYSAFPLYILYFVSASMWSLSTALLFVTWFDALGMVQTLSNWAVFC